MNGKGIWLLLMLTLSIPCAGQALQSRVNGSIAEANLVQALEKEVPSLMAKADIPGLSIALIKDWKSQYWNHGFGVKKFANKGTRN
jgi:CubicO group peptidase (beta-lactamase class C family)